jgi:hypothetical protein
MGRKSKTENAAAELISVVFSEFDGACPLENEAHEVYARARGIRGMTVTDSYLATGKESKQPKKQGEKVAKRPEVKARVAFFKTAVARAQIENVTWDRDEILRQLQENTSLAREVSQISASNKAIELYGSEAHGMFKKESVAVNVNIQQLEGRSTEQLAQLIQLRCEELGIDFDHAVSLLGTHAGTPAQLHAGDGQESGRGDPLEVEILQPEP